MAHDFWYEKFGSFWLLRGNMEIYSDDDYNPRIMRSCIVIISVITMLLQLPYIFLDSPYYSLIFSWLSVFLIVIFITFLYTKLGIKFLNKRVFSTVVLKSYCMIILAMYTYCMYNFVESASGLKGLILYFYS